MLTFSFGSSLVMSSFRNRTKSHAFEGIAQDSTGRCSWATWYGRSLHPRPQTLYLVWRFPLSVWSDTKHVGLERKREVVFNYTYKIFSMLINNAIQTITPSFRFVIFISTIIICTNFHQRKQQIYTQGHELGAK